MRVLFVATVVKTHIMQFHIPYLKMIKEMGWETAVAARNDYEDPADCTIPYCDAYYDIPFERNPFHPGNLRAYRMLKKVLDEGDYDIIHCHTPVGALLTRLAAGNARRRGSRVFYTAHGFHFYKGAPLINWLIYYPAERLLAHRTDVLITITQEDYRRARRFHAGRVEHIPGIGIDCGRFEQGSPQAVALLREQLGIPQSARVILSVGEVNANKNHRVVIEALPALTDTWYVLCGSGPLIGSHRRRAEALGVMDRVIMTGYRTDVSAYYNMADLFVLPSLREGLPVALMEAMAAGLVCVASRNRGAEELLGKSRLLFRASDVEDLKEKLRIALYTDCSEDVKNNRARLKAYDLSNTLILAKRLYLSCLEG